MSTRCSQIASLDNMDGMEPTLDIPVELAAVEVPAWHGADLTSSQVTRAQVQSRNCSSIVVNLPEQTTAKQARALCRDLKARLINVDQPHVILDLSDVKELDTAGLDLLLECLNQAVRRDGMVEVRSISPEAATILELTGMDQIFQLVPGATANSESDFPVDCLQEDQASSQPSLAA